jgi:sterol desaturase/sphingolipid hydroxylase (fatty acid hydroxylase superfamily)
VRGHAEVLGILLVTILLEVMARREWKVRYRSRSFGVDVAYYFFYYGGFYHFFFFKPLYAFLTGGVARYAPGLKLDLASTLSPVAQFAALILISEITGYWSHRLSHASGFLWRFHSIHHSEKRLNVMTNYRFHIVDETFRRLVLFVPSLMLGTHVTVWLWADLVGNWLLLLQHSEWNWTYGRLGHVFVSPVFHRKHHSTDEAFQYRNFGMLFTFWDDLFGTAERRLPAPTEYGLRGETVPESFFAQQLWPFRRLLGRAPADPAPAVREAAWPPPAEHVSH